MEQGFVEVTNMFEESAAVYMLCWNEEVLYVGKSKDVFTRVGDHRRRMRKGITFKFNRVLVRFCKPNELYRLEFTYIRKYRPRYNIYDNVIQPVTNVKVDLSSIGLDISAFKPIRRLI